MIRIRPVPFPFVSLHLAALLLLGMALPAGATSLARMGARTLAGSSDAIVHGTVVSTQARWNENRTLIVTDVRIRVTESLKGETGEEITVTHPGGAIGALRVEVPGAGGFRAGEEVVLFLAPGPFQRSHVNGLALGRFDVRRDAVTGRKVVRGLPAEGGGVLGAAQASAEEEAAVPLDRFLQDLRRVVQDVRKLEEK